jgi:outer membrane lipoprotein
MKPFTRPTPLGVAAVLGLLLASCISVPEPFRGDYPSLTPGTVSTRDVGTVIRWGGVILAAQPDEAQTCFEVLSRPLASSMRPQKSDQTLGRFIACRAGFLDPEVFARGREVTLTGTLTALDQRKVGDYDYRYPIVSAKFITMWPERIEVIVPDYDPFYRPWYWAPYYHYPYPYHHQPPVRKSYDRGPRVDVPPAEGSSG